MGLLISLVGQIDSKMNQIMWSVEILITIDITENSTLLYPNLSPLVLMLIKKVS